MAKNDKTKKTPVTIYNSNGEARVLEDVRMLDMVTNTSESKKAEPDDVDAIIPLAFAESFIPYFRDSVIKNSFYCSPYREFKNLFSFISRSLEKNYINIPNINAEGISIKETKFPDNLQEIVITLTSKDIEEYVRETSFDNSDEYKGFYVGVRDRNRKGVFIKKLMETLFADSYVFNSELGGVDGMYSENNLSRCKLTYKGIKIKSLSDSASEFKGKFSNIKTIVIKIKNTFSPQFYLHGMANSIKLLDTENFMRNRGRDSHKVSGDEIAEAKNTIITYSKNKDMEDCIDVIKAYETILTGFMERYNNSFTKNCVFDNNAIFKHVEIEVEIRNKDFSSIKNLSFYPGFKPDNNSNNDAKMLQSIRDIVVSYCKYNSIDDKARTSIEIADKINRVEKYENETLATSTSEISNTIKNWSDKCIKDSISRFVTKRINCSKRFNVNNLYLLENDNSDKVYIPLGYNGLSDMKTLTVHFTDKYIGITPEALEHILKELTGKDLVTFYNSENDAVEEEEVYEVYKLLGLYSPYHNKISHDYKSNKLRIITRGSHIWSLRDYEGTIELKLKIPVYLSTVENETVSNPKKPVEFETNLVFELEMI